MLPELRRLLQPAADADDDRGDEAQRERRHRGRRGQVQRVHAGQEEERLQ